MDNLKHGDSLQITIETVNYYKATRWSHFFQLKHIGETVEFAGQCNPMCREDDYQIAFRDGRGVLATPACSSDVVTAMRQAYLRRKD